MQDFCFPFFFFSMPPLNLLHLNESTMNEFANAVTHHAGVQQQQKQYQNMTANIKGRLTNPAARSPV